jgi:hypothetical protein
LRTAMFEDGDVELIILIPNPRSHDVML